MMLAHARDADAVDVLTHLKRLGYAIPISMVIAAESPRVTVDTFQAVANPETFVIVVRHGRTAEVMASREDAIHELAVLLLGDGYAMEGSVAAMHRLAGWMLKRLPIPREQKRELRKLARGEVLSPSPDLDESMTEELWGFAGDPNAIAVAMAQAFDP